MKLLITRLNELYSDLEHRDTDGGADLTAFLNTCTDEELEQVMGLVSRVRGSLFDVVSVMLAESNARFYEKTKLSPKSADTIIFSK